MSALSKRWCWRKDLSEFRGLSEQERAGFLLVLEWFENFRLRHEMEASRDAAKAFWRTEVQRDDRKREAWQLDQWSDAVQWYLAWLSACEEAGADHRRGAERGVETRLHPQDEDFAQGAARNDDLAENRFAKASGHGTSRFHGDLGVQ